MGWGAVLGGLLSLLTRQMEWVTGGSGDEKAVLRFMNKCKHSGAQLPRLVIFFWVGVWGKTCGDIPTGPI